MATLKEESVNYETPKTKNIADLDIVSLSTPVSQAEKVDSDGKPFRYNYIVVNGDDYRVPNSVLDEIKMIIKENPSVTHVRVIRDGTGMNTRYKVVQKAIDTDIKEVSSQKV